MGLDTGKPAPPRARAGAQTRVRRFLAPKVSCGWSCLPCSWTLPARPSPKEGAKRLLSSVPTGQKQAGQAGRGQLHQQSPSGDPGLEQSPCSATGAAGRAARSPQGSILSTFSRRPEPPAQSHGSTALPRWGRGEVRLHRWLDPSSAPAAHQEDGGLSVPLPSVPRAWLRDTHHHPALLPLLGAAELCPACSPRGFAACRQSSARPELIFEAKQITLTIVFRKRYQMLRVHSLFNLLPLMSQSH